MATQSELWKGRIFSQTAMKSSHLKQVWGNDTYFARPYWYNTVEQKLFNIIQYLYDLMFIKPGRAVGFLFLSAIHTMKYQRKTDPIFFVANHREYWQVLKNSNSRLFHRLIR